MEKAKILSNRLSSSWLQLEFMRIYKPALPDRAETHFWEEYMYEF